MSSRDYPTTGEAIGWLSFMAILIVLGMMFQPTEGTTSSATAVECYHVPS